MLQWEKFPETWTFTLWKTSTTHFGTEWISAFVNEIQFYELFSASDGIHTIMMEAPDLLKSKSVA